MNNNSYNSNNNNNVNNSCHKNTNNDNKIDKFTNSANDAVFPNLEVTLGRIKLENPVITCSGTFASGIEYSKFVNLDLIGAITTKSFSLKRIAGNKPPRICETPSGMINSIGLQNEGIDYFIKTDLEMIKKNCLKFPKIILSIFGSSVEEFIKIAYKVKLISNYLIALELNFSCPNVSKDGIAFSAFPEQVKQIIYEIRNIIDIGIIAKLSPNFDTITECSIAAKEAGADAVAIINTILAASFDVNTFKSKIGNVVGGLSGPAIKPIAVLKVFQLAKKNIIPIIGMGGIASTQDALEFIIAGANAVGIGTANFIDPKISIKIIEGIRNFLIEKNISDINKLIGIALK